MAAERSLFRSNVRTITAVVVVVLLLASIPGTALAETRTGGSVVVGADETVDGDLTVFAGSVVIDGTVEGNVQAVGGSVRIGGTVTGDVSVTAGSVVIGPNATIEGSLQGAGGDVVIAGTITDDVQVGAETITVTETAVINGEFTYDGSLDRASGASIAGTVSADADLGFDSPLDVSIPGWIISAYAFMVGLLGAVVLLGLFPEFSRSVASAATDDPLRTGGAGVLAVVGIPVGLLVLVLTLVGIPLALIGLFVYLIGLWVGSLYGRYAIGTFVLAQFETDNRWLALLAGFILIALLVRIPLVGGLIQLVVAVLGLGGVAVMMVRRYRAHRGEENNDAYSSDQSERVVP
ncbi:putative membrane protein related to bactofilin [Halorhabdus sp. SVX81]|uniref:polymer-forming cytoskeletal protein n=1 Tax=Halorhabdus sp. SVX81 TaxID=2978283 RepID=UPI0023DCE3BF|nr:polymer-forming cytoskeletal protein [Halorhabdus sp. SVX81]WEL17406.1 putative membrane protein related to bactofilin [Halorhabdus sp. SVX81]